MTVDAPARPRLLRARFVPIAGFLLGALDFVWIKYVPWPLGDLGNSSAIWAIAAFLLTWRSSWRLPKALIAASVMLVVAVPSYYLAAALIQQDDLENMWAVTSLAWMAFGVVAGIVFGGAGVVARTPGAWGRALAFSLPAGVLVAEVLRLYFRTDLGDEPPFGGTSVVRLVLAAALVLLLPPTWKLRAGATLCVVPVAVVGHLLFGAAGFA